MRKNLASLSDTVGTHHVPAWHGGILPLQVIAFDPASFGAHAFAEHRIACPPSIARSVPKRQAEFFYGRMAARRALEPFGMGAYDVGTGNAREPLWPAGIMGSITHNRHYAAAAALDIAANRGLGIGIDIEAIVAPDHEQTLLASVVAPAELAYLRSLSNELPFDLLLTMVFSAKESFFKASFNTVGRFFDFDAITLLRIDPQGRTLWFEIGAALAPQLPASAVCQVHYTMIDASTVCTSCNLPAAPDQARSNLRMNALRAG